MTTIRTIEPRLSGGDAVERTAATSLRSYVVRRLRRATGGAPEPIAVRRLYYPNYVAYSTVTIPRRLAADRVEKLLGGVDGITARSGAVDYDLPPRETRDAETEAVLRPEIDRERAREVWREWIFEHASREFRPIRRPEFELDSLELVYVPYWIVEFDESAYAVSGLTKAADPIETRPSMADRYRETAATS